MPVKIVLFEKGKHIESDKVIFLEDEPFQFKKKKKKKKKKKNTC